MVIESSRTKSADLPKPRSRAKPNPVSALVKVTRTQYRPDRITVFFRYLPKSASVSALLKLTHWAWFGSQWIG